MLTQELRPQRLKDMVGNELNKELLLAIAKNPETTPSTLMFHGAFGSGKCVTGDTKIKTREGYKRIRDLQTHDEDGFTPYEGPAVLTTKGYRKPSHLYRQQDQDTIRITTSSGHTIEGTPNHPILCVGDDLTPVFIRMGELQRGHIITIHTPATSSMKEPDEQAWRESEVSGTRLPTDITERTEEYQASFIAQRLHREGTRLLTHSPEECEALTDTLENLCIGYTVNPPHVTLHETCLIGLARIVETITGKKTALKQPHWYLTQQTRAYITSQLSSEDPLLPALAPEYLNLLQASQVTNNPVIAEKLKNLLQFRQTIITQVTRGKNTVYDLTVPEEHNFYSNGLISHNTTSARLIAKAMNCRHLTNDLCGTCEVCTSDIQSTPYYTEYDASSMGNVESVRNLRDTFHYTVPGRIRTIVIDEIQEASKQAQGALLKEFEEAPRGVKFILCTTDPQKVLPTIRSRSLELQFDTQTPEDVKNHLQKVAPTLGIEISDEVAELIAVRSRGHMRNAHMLLDQYRLIGEESFRKTVRSAKQDVLRTLVFLKKRDKDKFCKSVDQLLTHPLADLIEDYQRTILDVMKCQLGIGTHDEQTMKVVQFYGPDTVKIARLCTQNWILDAFTNDIILQTALLALYQQLEPAQTQQPTANRNQK